MEQLIGSIIQLPRWPEPIKGDPVEDIGKYARIVGATLNSCTHIDQVLPKSELGEMKSREIKAQFTANTRQVFLALGSPVTLITLDWWRWSGYR